MVCSMVKKGLVGAALSAGALYLAFGTSAPSYVTTAFHKVRHNAKDSVPIRFEIDRARDQIAALEPAIENNKEELARAEVDVEYLGREIEKIEANLAKEKGSIVTLREGLSSGDLKLAGRRVSYTADEVKGELANRLDHYRNVKRILEEKQTTLKAREQAVAGARLKWTEMASQKRVLATKLESIQARLQAIEATQERNEFSFDDSALAKAKETVAGLEKRLEVKARLAEMEGHYAGDSVQLTADPDRDVLKEVDAEFGPTKDAKTGDKSL